MTKEVKHFIPMHNYKNIWGINLQQSSLGLIMFVNYILSYIIIVCYILLGKTSLSGETTGWVRLGLNISYAQVHRTSKTAIFWLYETLSKKIKPTYRSLSFRYLSGHFIQIFHVDILQTTGNHSNISKLVLFTLFIHNSEMGSSRHYELVPRCIY